MGEHLDFEAMRAQIVQTASMIQADFGFSSHEWEDRIKGISLRNNKVELEFASDGMNLDHKMSLEKSLLPPLQKSLRQDVHLRFRRQQPQVHKRQGEPTRKQDSRRVIPGVKKVIAVASGKGGVGKSTVSVNLAVSFANKGFKVGLLDADIYGPSAPLMMNLKGEPLVNEGKLQPLSNYGVQCASIGFFSDALNPVMWRGPMVTKALNQLLFDVNWGELDVLVLDLPPGTGDVQLSLLEGVKLDGGVIVSTPQDVSLIDAHKAISMFQSHRINILGYIENMSGHRCSECGHEDDIFGSSSLTKMEKMRGIPPLGSIPIHPSICAAGDRGEPISAGQDNPSKQQFLEIADQLWATLSFKKLN